MYEISSLIVTFLKEHLGQIAGIILLFLFGKLLLKRLVRKIARLIGNHGSTPTKQKRKEQQMRTFAQVVITTGNVMIYSVIVFMILDLFNVNLGPVLTGAGIIGLAVGFGSQTLVKDFVSGLFIIMEQQYGIGDEVKIGDAEGEVIKMTMRSTVLKDKEGNRIFLTNGTITKVINRSQGMEKAGK